MTGSPIFVGALALHGVIPMREATWVILKPGDLS